MAKFSKILGRVAADRPKTADRQDDMAEFGGSSGDRWAVSDRTD